MYQHGTLRAFVIVLNLALFVTYPIAWFAPLIKAGLFPELGIEMLDRLPYFGLSEISVMSGLEALWGSDIVLALLVTVFALFAPVLKTLGLALVHFEMLDKSLNGALAWIGKLAMADIFLIALYIIIVKGMQFGEVESDWGLYLFSGCILASVVISGLTPRAMKKRAYEPEPFKY
ncbi:MAG: paraquat-inducible protein A [Pseudomonadota bacterium]